MTIDPKRRKMRNLMDEQPEVWLLCDGDGGVLNVFAEREGAEAEISYWRRKHNEKGLHAVSYRLISTSAAKHLWPTPDEAK